MSINPRLAVLTISLLVTVLLLPLPGQSVLECKIDAESGGCSGTNYVSVMQLVDTSNSHAANGGSYQYHICCRDSLSPLLDAGTSACTIGSEGNEHSVVARLSASTNAHIEADDGTTDPNYNGNDVCIGSSAGSNADCQYISGSSCATILGPGYECVARASGLTNAHVSDCRSNDYGYMICCKIDVFSDTNDPITTDNFCPSDWTSNDRNDKQLTYTDSESGCEAIRHCTALDPGTCNPDTAPWLNFDSGDDSSPATKTVWLTCPADSVCQYSARYYSRDVPNPTSNIETEKGTTCLAGIDKQDPQTTATPDRAPDAGSYYTSSVDVTLSCNDQSGSGCSGIEYCVDSINGCNPSTSYSSPVTISSSGTNFLRFKSTDSAGNVESIGFVSIELNLATPSGQVEGFSDPWTTTDTFDVTYTADGGSALLQTVTVQYRIKDLLDDSIVVDWTDWFVDNTPSSPETHVFGLSNNPVDVNNYDNHSFEFRIRVVNTVGQVFDYADNTQIPIKYVDLTSPVTTLHPPLALYQLSATFDISAVSEESGSGIGVISCQMNYEGSGWVDVGIGEGICDIINPGYSMTTECTVNNEGQYEFRCRANDIAGNLGIFSGTNTTIYDSSAPDLLLIEPTFNWTRGNSFNVRFDSFDPDIERFEVYYESNEPGNPPPSGTEWNQWVDETIDDPAIIHDEHTITFSGAGNPFSGSSLEEDEVYYVNITAVDTSGRRVSVITNMSIDNTVPLAKVIPYDMNNMELENGFIQHQDGITDYINITLEGYDHESGILRSEIVFFRSGDNGPSAGNMECGPMPPGEMSLCYTYEVPNRYDVEYGKEINIRYRGIVRDLVGNVNETVFYSTVTHPLANFGSAFYYIELGDSILAPVFVRNIQDGTAEITLSLTPSSYQFAYFEYECDGSFCDISADRRTMTIYDVISHNEDIEVKVKIYSSEPGDYLLNLTATTDLDATLLDYHEIALQMNYPVYFPGLGTESLILLAILSVAVFGLLTRKNII